MELLGQVSNTQFLFPAAAVAVVLVCAALVFIFGFHTAEQPQFDKLPLVLDDRKSSSKKKKIKDKKSSPNRTANEDVKSKSEASKKSPVKEKKDEKTKDEEKPKPRERVVEPKPVKKDAEPKKGKKSKGATEAEKPADFDDGGWQEVPKKSDKKKVKTEEKKESPAKKPKNKKTKDSDVEAARPTDEPVEEKETIKVVVADGPAIDEEVARALQMQVEELQRVLKEAERRDQGLPVDEEEEEEVNTTEPEDLPEVKDLRSTKKKENKEKQNKKKIEAANKTAAPKGDAVEKGSDLSDGQEEKPNAPVFDELGDTWTDAKVSKKSKKKARKDQ